LDTKRRQLLAWVAEHLGQPVVDHQPLVGGCSSLILLCRFSGGGHVVVRQIENAAWLAREPTIIAQEATALRLLSDSQPGPLMTPELVAADVEAGRLVMSFLPGRLRADAHEIRAGASAMAATAAAIAAVELPPDHGLPTFRPWVGQQPAPPPWGDQALWREAIDLYLTRRADRGINRHGWPSVHGDNPVLLHRDFHPLNLLWPDPSETNAGPGSTSVSSVGNGHGNRPAVVDWLNACVGHPHAELGHCRWNLAVLADPDTADRFLAHYLALAPDGGEPYDPLWDLVSVLSLSGGEIGVGWRAVGRHDLTESAVVQATMEYLNHIMTQAVS